MNNSFENGFVPPEAQEVKEPKWQKTLERFRANYPNISNSYSYGERVGAPNGGSGEIVDVTGRKGDEIAVVNTDTGVVADKNREMITDGLYGCAGLFIQTPTCNEMVHMTPGNRLGYKYHKFKETDQKEFVAHHVQKILAALPEGASLEESRGIIVVNVAEETYPGHNDYHAEKQQEAWGRLKSLFAEAGLKNMQLVEVPMDRSALYYTPERPDEVLIMGARMGISEDGSYNRDESDKVDEYWLPLDKPTDFALHKQ